MKEEDLKNLDLEKLNNYTVRGLSAKENIKRTQEWRKENPEDAEKIQQILNKKTSEWIKNNSERHLEFSKKGAKAAGKVFKDEERAKEIIEKRLNAWDERDKAEPGWKKSVYKTVSTKVSKFIKENPEIQRTKAINGGKTTAKMWKDKIFDRNMAIYNNLPEEEFTSRELKKILTEMDLANYLYNFLATHFVIRVYEGTKNSPKDIPRYIKNPDIKG